MSGKDLIDDYLSELMDDPDKGATPPASKSAGKHESPASKSSAAAPADSITEVEAEPPAEEPASASASAATESTNHEAPVTPTAEPSVESSTDTSPSEAEMPSAASTPKAAAEGETADPLAAFREGGNEISEDEFEAMLDAMNGSAPSETSGKSAPESATTNQTGDPLESFRSGSSEIGDDEFEAMLDALQGKAPDPTEPSARPPGTAGGDPLQAFRQGGDDIGEDEFEAMLDALSGKPGAQPSPAPPAAAPTPAPIPAESAPAAPLPLPVRNPAAELLAPNDTPERRRRAEDKVSSWLRFNIGVQCFAVEVLKVQEVLRVPSIMPVRGTGEAMLGVMNLRGQIVPVMDTGIRLGFGPVDVSEASRVVVLEESGDSLGLLVSAVADVVNISDTRIERISGTPSLVNAEVVRGISRREGGIIVLLDATRMLAL